MSLRAVFNGFLKTLGGGQKWEEVEDGRGLRLHGDMDCSVIRIMLVEHQTQEVSFISHSC